MCRHHVVSIDKAQGTIEGLDPGHRATGYLHSLERCGKDRIEFHRTMSGVEEIDAWLIAGQRRRYSNELELGRGIMGEIVAATARALDNFVHELDDELALSGFAINLAVPASSKTERHPKRIFQMSWSQRPAVQIRRFFRRDHGRPRKGQSRIALLRVTRR
jgi:hypothetical protein